MENQKIAYNVYVTRDYSIFKRLLGNRDVPESRINKIINSIQAVGWIHNPIVVNEKMEIIDGQGRLTALQRLKMPVEYIISPGAGSQACIHMNLNMVNWKQADFIKSYAELGDANYQRLLKLMDNYANGNLHIIFTATHRISKPKHREIKAGTLQLTEEQYQAAIPRLQYVQPLLEKLDANRIPGGMIMLIQTLIYYFDYEEVDKTRLLDKVEKFVYGARAWATNLDCERQVEELYNMHVKFNEKQSIQYLIQDEKMRRQAELSKELSKRAYERTQKGVQGFIKSED